MGGSIRCARDLGPSRAACATTPPQLEPYPGVGKRIIAYHDGQSATDDPACTATRMRTIGAMEVPSDTPRRLAVSVQYFYDTENHDEFHGGCQGQGTHAFTLDEAGDALTVAGVSGPQGGL